MIAKLTATAWAKNLVEIDLFSDIHRVEEALRRHSCSEALMWCSQNKTALTKMKVSIALAYYLVRFADELPFIS